MARMPRIDSAAAFWLFLLGALALLGLNLDFPLWEPWEPKNARTAVEMVQRGDLLTPFFRDDPRFFKPPLMYWLMAPGYALFGLNEVAMRLPFVLIAVAGLGTFVYALRRLFSASVGYLSAVVLLTSPMFFFLARQLTTDAILVSFLMIALSLTALALFREERRTPHLVLAYLAGACAVLSKGPLALFLLAGTLGLYGVATLIMDPESRRTPFASTTQFRSPPIGCSAWAKAPPSRVIGPVPVSERRSRGRCRSRPRSLRHLALRRARRPRRGASACASRCSMVRSKTLSTASF